MYHHFDMPNRCIEASDRFWRVFQGRDGEYEGTRQWDVIAGSLAEAQEIMAEQGHVIDTHCGWEHTNTFVAFYEVEQAYGGPEEGGWWYETGGMVALIPVHTYGEIWVMRDKLQSECEMERVSWNEAVHPSDLPASFPAVRPHYE